MYSFREMNTMEKRIEERTRLLQKYPDRIPVVVEKFSGDKILPPLTKTRYVLPRNTTIGQFLYIIRSTMPELRPSHSVFLFISNTAPPVSVRLGDLYDSLQESDGFLYCIISCEATFG